MSFAQVNFIVNKVPDNMPEDANIFLSGDFEGWTGGQDEYELNKTESGLYHIQLNLSGQIQYKFTLGNWDSVEKGPNGEEISNRIFDFSSDNDSVYHTIHNWTSSQSGGSTASENVIIWNKQFPMTPLPGTRTIRIYLPPDYKSSTKHYPVIYMHDGQNLFDNNTSFSGEWRVDETMDQLYSKTGFTALVVGIDNGGSSRIAEYTPWENSQYGGGKGDDYLKFIVNNLKPSIDSAFRTKKDKANTGLWGSSLGGLISYYGGLAYPDVFGMIGVFSPSFWFSNQIDSFTKTNANIDNQRMFFLSGGQESNSISVPAETSEIIALMKANGYPENGIRHIIVENGTHSESFWRNHVKEGLNWLFEEWNLLTEVNIEKSIKIYPNPAQDSIHIITNLKKGLVKVLDASGKEFLKQRFHTSSFNLDVSTLERGHYVLKIENEEEHFTERFVLN